MGVNFHDLRLTWRPNQYLVLPSGFAAKATPHRLSPSFAMAPSALLDALERVALAEARTSVLSKDKSANRLELVQRSKTFRFPDYVSVEAVAAGSGGSALAIYSRAKYGIRDFGVNRARVDRWLAALERDAKRA